MPDWSYQTLLRPLLFRLPAVRARALALGAFGALGAGLPGPPLIRLLGHATPAPSLRRAIWGLTFPSPVGLGADLPGNEVAATAIAQLGVGFIELGPVMLQPCRATSIRGQSAVGSRQSPEPLPTTPLQRLPAEQAIWLPAGTPCIAADALLAALARYERPGVPLGVRLAHTPGVGAAAAAAERCALMACLAPLADFFTLTPFDVAWNEVAWQAHLAQVAACAHRLGKPLLVAIPPDADAATLELTLAPAVAQGLPGVLICGGVAAPAGGRLLGRPAHAATLATLRQVRARWGNQLAIMVAGGIHEPADALALLAAGAACVQLDSGLVYAGPGLAKRCNEAIRFFHEPAAPPPRLTLGTLLRSNWLWLLLLGLGMLLGGTLAWLIAATSVVLPYDEAFIGIGRAQLAAINPRLLPFMAHDRVTLAGTMISIGVLYAMLALYAVRLHEHWARRAIAVSATLGFLSFFLFLGFGYFDPLHALVALLLLPLFLLGLCGTAGAPPAVPAPDLHNDHAWRLALWGQLGFVGIGVGLIGAGLAIAFVGITQVFVPEDLAFLQITPSSLHAANPRLVPLIAHDRAGFGGALVSDGLAALLVALWGIRRGARWVWWMLLAAGLPGFIAAIGVHVAVGYLDSWHLLPAYLAVAVYAASLAALFPYLCDSDDSQAAE